MRLSCWRPTTMMRQQTHSTQRSDNWFVDHSSQVLHMRKSHRWQMERISRIARKWHERRVGIRYSALGLRTQFQFHTGTQRRSWRVAIEEILLSSYGANARRSDREAPTLQSCVITESFFRSSCWPFLHSDGVFKRQKLLAVFRCTSAYVWIIVLLVVQVVLRRVQE